MVDFGSGFSASRPLRRHPSSEGLEPFLSQAPTRVRSGEKWSTSSTAVASAMLRPEGCIDYNMADALGSSCLGFVKESKGSRRRPARKAHSALPPSTRCQGIAFPDWYFAASDGLPSSPSATPGGRQACLEEAKISAMLLDLGVQNEDRPVSQVRCSRNRSSPPAGAKLEPLSRRPKGGKMLTPHITASSSADRGLSREPGSRAARRGLESSLIPGDTGSRPLMREAWLSGPSASGTKTAARPSRRHDTTSELAGRCRIIPGSTMEEDLFGDDSISCSEDDSDLEEYIVDDFEWDDEEEDV